MTNVGNERGEIFNLVFTTGEEDGWQQMCQGIVKRYKDANQPEPQIIYVDTGIVAAQDYLKVSHRSHTIAPTC